MTATLLPQGRQRYFDDNGLPLAGGLVYTFAAGTSTPQAAYQDADGTVPHANPIVLDAKGEAVVFWSGNYKVNVKTTLGVQVTGWPVDNMRSDPLGFGAALSAYIANIASSIGSSLMGFIQAGVGAVARTVQAELRETLKPQQFGALGDGATDDTTAWTRLKTQATAVKGRVFVPPGTYRLQPGFDLTANDTEWHFAPGAILKLVDAQATTSFITLTAPQNQKMLGMRVDGNRAVQNAALFGPDNCAVLVVDAKNCQFDRTEIISSPAKGLALVSTPGGTTRNTTVSNFVGADCKEQVLIVDGNNITGFFERIVINGVLIGTTSGFGLCLNDGASNVEVSNVISKTGNTISDAVYIRDSFDLQLTNVRGSSARNGIGVERLNGYTGRIQLNNVVGEFNSQNGILLLGAEDVSGGTVTGRNNGTAGINIAQTGALVRCKRISISNPVGYDDQGGGATQDYGILVQGVDTCRLGPHIAYGNTVRSLSINRSVSTDVKADTRQTASVSTGSIAASGQATITVNWPVAFEDSSIDLDAPWLFEATGSTALAVAHVQAITQTVVQVQVYNRSGTTAHTATLNIAGSRTP